MTSSSEFREPKRARRRRLSDRVAKQYLEIHMVFVHSDPNHMDCDCDWRARYQTHSVESRCVPQSPSQDGRGKTPKEVL